MLSIWDKGKRDLRTHIKSIIESAVDIVLPPQSLLTGSVGAGGIEGDIWGEVNFLDEPCCNICGFPFEFDVGASLSGHEALCGRCIIIRPAYHAARAAFQYDDLSRSLVLGFKHGGRTEGLGIFAAHMRRAGRSFLGGADYLVPVPLHYSRRVKRRYNQSSLLARALARITKAEFNPDILLRHRATPTQGGKSASGRRRNVQGAFRVRESKTDSVRGAKIVLIDDVMTTGATLEACALTLKRAGAAQICALTLSRVVKAAPLPT
jgi:ComF family protein